ncbi:hypothetical protein [Vibrio aerogenes]|uniref:hypothetical protein n=1 Tax=Vibrio aerogenes TaxID=92172 RepID=UPI001114DC2C|nr:hypothetical protein [Vibrio aerogenes]
MTLVLMKGEICPGQRGRIHRLFPVLALLWASVAVQHLLAMVVTALIAGLYTRVKTGKTRDSGPLMLLWLADMAALVLVIMTIVGMPDWIGGVVIAFSTILSGAISAHLLLVMAKSRLQAFHKLLPAVGVLAAMMITVCIVPFTYGLSDEQLSIMTSSVLIYFSLMIAGLLLWCWHLFLSSTVSRVLLALSCLLLLSSMTGFNSLYQHNSQNQHIQLSQQSLNCPAHQPDCVIQRPDSR